MGLLVGLAVGLVVLAAGTHMLAQHLKGHRMGLQSSRLQHDLHAALALMDRELRRTQYVAYTRRAPTVCDDEFCDGPEDFQINGNRIDFSYDRNHNGTQDNNECLGFRLLKGALQARTACSPEVWTAITDTGSIELTELHWRLECSAQAGWLHRSVHVQLSAHWPADPSSRLTRTHAVHLRNALPVWVQTRYCP